MSVRWNLLVGWSIYWEHPYNLELWGVKVHVLLELRLARGEL